MFNLNAFVCFGSFGGKQAIGYTTDDTKNTIEAADYFNAAAKFCNAGDIIFVAGDLDGTPFHSSYVVSSNNGSTVEVTEHSAVTQNVVNIVTAEKISAKAADAEVFRFVAPFAGSITKIYTVLNAALAAADATVTAKINGTAVTNGVVTQTQAGSAAGDVDSATPTAANTFAAGDVITLTTGGGSTATGTFNASLVLTPS